MFLWILFLHNYIIPQKRLHPFFFWMQPFLLFFYSPFNFTYKVVGFNGRDDRIRTCDLCVPKVV